MGRSEYTFGVWASAGTIARLKHFARGVQLWSKVETRKSHKCQVTGDIIISGDQAFAPVTHATNRWHRISIEGMIKLCEGR